MIYFLFSKRFIFIIGFCFFPITLYSQSSSEPSYIWEEVQKTINVITLFKIHDLSLENRKNARLIYNQNHETYFTFFTFEPFIETFIFSMTETHPQIPEQVVEDIKLRLSNTLIPYENMRLKTLGGYLHSHDMEVQKNVAPIFRAISNRDSPFFNNLTEEQKKMLSIAFLTKIEREQVKYLFTSNFLLEAIRQSFLPAVQYILSNYHESQIGS